jgi:hypothetical protein
LEDANAKKFFKSTMPQLCLFLLFSLVFGSGGVSVPSFDECVDEYLTHRNIINTTVPGEDNRQVGRDCVVKIETEVAKFHDDIERLIRTGAKIDHLENSAFVTHEKCIMENLRHFNVSDMFLKGLNYQKLAKLHHSDHNYNQRMSSQQILLQYALQVCDPRSFYKRNEENLFKMNMRTTDEQAICLLNYINENISAETYKFSDKIDQDFESEANCTAIVRKFIQKYYYVLDRQRSFSVFGLNPTGAIKCRTSNDKSLIDNILLLTIFNRLQLTPDEVQAEKARFYEIARHSARSFFQCISMYD